MSDQPEPIGPAADEQEYMTWEQVVAYCNVAEATLTQALNNGRMPYPDLRHKGHDLWLQQTIYEWRRPRVKHGRQFRELAATFETTRLDDLEPAEGWTPELDALALLAETPSAGVSVEQDPPVTVERETAARVALELRAEGWFIMTRDVIDLAASSAGALEWERQQLRARVMERLQQPVV